MQQLSTGEDEATGGKRALDGDAIDGANDKALLILQSAPSCGPHPVQRHFACGFLYVLLVTFS
jgi:hypothetical protein